MECYQCTWCSLKYAMLSVYLVQVKYIMLSVYLVKVNIYNAISVPGAG